MSRRVEDPSGIVKMNRHYLPPLGKLVVLAHCFRKHEILPFVKICSFFKIRVFFDVLLGKIDERPCKLAHQLLEY